MDRTKKPSYPATARCARCGYSFADHHGWRTKPCDRFTTETTNYPSVMDYCTNVVTHYERGDRSGCKAATEMNPAYWLKHD